MRRPPEKDSSAEQEEFETKKAEEEPVEMKDQIEKEVQEEPAKKNQPSQKNKTSKSSEFLEGFELGNIFEIILIILLFKFLLDSDGFLFSGE